MQKFRDFLLNEDEESESEAEDGDFPLVTTTAPAGSSSIEDQKRSINADLAEATIDPFSWTNAGYEAIKDVLADYHLNLPDDGYDDLEDDEAGETVMTIEGTDLYLYIFHERGGDGVEFYAEVVNEAELHDLLDAIDVGENENDDDGDSDDDGEEDNDHEYDE